jgi:O-antigen/teichoic acid export membrane protein
VHGARELRLATNEAGILAAGFGFPIFAILAGTGTGVTELWLGPGWDAAGVLVVILAPVAALQVVFNVLANSSEMQGHFLPVRTAQFWLAAGLLPGLGLLVATRDLRWAGAALLISQSASLVVLCIKLNSQDAILRNRFLIDISLQLGIAILIGFGSFGASVMVESTSLTVAGSAAIASVFAGGIAGLIVLAVTIRLNPAPSILYRRGISVPSMLLPRRRREKRQRAAE